MIWWLGAKTGDDVLFSGRRVVAECQRGVVFGGCLDGKTGVCGVEDE